MNNMFSSDGAGRQGAAQTAASVLVVDDEPDVADVLAEGLAYAGYDVAQANSGAQALILLQERAFDVLITDVHMPRMRGDELQRQARILDPNLAVLLVSAANDLTTAVQCLRDGVFDYLTKPFDLQDVAVHVGKALERRRLLRENREYQQTLEQRVSEQADRIRLMFQNSLVALNHALEAKDGYTRDHSFRVTEIAAALAAWLRPDDDEFVQKLRVAAMFHDIGKIGVSERVLNKPDKLTGDEFAEIQRHPVIGETILRPLFDDSEMLAIVRNHHEAWNGAGYPDGLTGLTIPFGARIVAVADSYDAMTSMRSYRPGMPPERALQLLRDGAGVQWDAAIVEVLLELAESGALPSLFARSDPSLRLSDDPGRPSAALILPLLYSDQGAFIAGQRAA